MLNALYQSIYEYPYMLLKKILNVSSIQIWGVLKFSLFIVVNVFIIIFIILIIIISERVVRDRASTSGSQDSLI